MLQGPADTKSYFIIHGKEFALQHRSPSHKLKLGARTISADDAFGWLDCGGKA